MKKRILTVIFLVSVIIVLMTMTNVASASTFGSIAENYPSILKDITNLRRVETSTGRTISFTNDRKTKTVTVNDSDGPQGQGIWEEVWEYNEKGNVMRVYTERNVEEYEYYANGNMRKNGYFSYEYNEDGTIAKYRDYTFVHQDNLLIEFNDNGDIVWRCTEIGDDIDTYLYEYVGTSVQPIVSDLGPNFRCKIHLKNNQYDEQGRVTYDAKTKHKLVYDAKGRLIYSSYNEGSAWTKFEYEELQIYPSEGKSTINNIQGTGDVFTFTAITDSTVNKISLLADKFDGSEWHTIPFEYLQKHYQLEVHINSDNEKVWTCKFDIHDVGERTFKLIVDDVDTSVVSHVTVLENNGNFTPTPQKGEILVAVNGDFVDFDIQPQIINGRTMIPVRAVAEAFGATVDWDQNRGVAEIRGYNRREDVYRVCYVEIGSNSMAWEDEGSWLNGGEGGYKELDAPAIIIDGRTLVPIRAIAEVFGYDVEWDNETRTVEIFGQPIGI